MHRFAIVEHDNPQIFSNFFYSTPFFDPSIGLYFNFCWFLNNCLDPILLDLSAIRAFSCIIKILRGFHLSKSNQIIGAKPFIIRLRISFQIAYYFLNLTILPSCLNPSINSSYELVRYPLEICAVIINVSDNYWLISGVNVSGPR